MRASTVSAQQRVVMTSLGRHTRKEPVQSLPIRLRNIEDDNGATVRRDLRPNPEYCAGFAKVNRAPNTTTQKSPVLQKCRSTRLVHGHLTRAIGSVALVLCAEQG